MASTTLTYPASKLTENVTMTIKVTGMRVFKARWTLATWLMMAAAKVAGCGLQIDTAHREK